MSDKEERIRQRAYEKWQQEGETHGWHDRHWNEAESEIASESESSLEGETLDEAGAATPLRDEAEASATQDANMSAADAATPMMDDAGMPESNEIKTDAGAAASSAAVAGIEPGKRRSASSGKSAGKKKG